MKTKSFLPRPVFAALAIAALLNACVPSLHPFYTENDLITDPRILGRWESGDTAWTFEPADGQALKVSVIDGAKRGTFVGHLFKLQDHVFLDLTAHDIELAPDLHDIVKWSLIAGHLVLFVQSIEPKLQLRLCNGDWAEKYLAAHPDALAHRDAKNGFVLTGDTPSLQRFVLAHLGDGELFGDIVQRDYEGLTRVAPALATPPKP